MTRRRLFQALFSGLFVAFLLVLAYRFKPKIEAPPVVEQPKPSEGAAGALSAAGFHFTQQTEGRTEYEVTARAVTEVPGGLKRLSDPVVTIPGQGKAVGALGSFDPASKTLRIWDEARLLGLGGWTASSSGFHFDSGGEILSEGPVKLVRGGATGSADLFRYDRRTRVAGLEGKVRLESGGALLACPKVKVNLATHRGRLAGPVTVTRGDTALGAPVGTLLLGPDNALRRIVLGPPSSGKGPSMAYEAATTSAIVGKDGSLESVRLAGGVTVRMGGKGETTLTTGGVDLFPAGGPLWRWRAPGELSLAREGSTARAPSGEGSFGGDAGPEARLRGPVTGRDGKDTFRGESALLSRGDWTLSGRAEVVSPTRRLRADRITRKGDRSLEAEGSVEGKETKGKGSALTFTCGRAFRAAEGYPVLLEDRVKVVRGAMTLTAPRVRVLSGTSVVAEEGAAALFKGAEGHEEKVRGQTIRYDGEKHLARAEGKARGEGRDHWVSAESLTAVLDANDRPLRYEARGGCRFGGTLYGGEADRLTYDPATREGKAESPGGRAVVTRKSPLQRVSGSAVAFGPKRLEVMEATEGRVRGSVEGTAEKRGSKARQESKTHGR